MPLATRNSKATIGSPGDLPGLQPRATLPRTITIPRWSNRNSPLPPAQRSFFHDTPPPSFDLLFFTSRATEPFDSVASLPYLTIQRSSPVTPAIEIHNDRIAEFCARHRIRRLALFGSVLRPDFRPESDVDVLVEFEPGASIGYFALARIERELSTLLGGRKVDLRTPQDLSRYFRSSVIAGAYVIHGPS